MNLRQLFKIDELPRAVQQEFIGSFTDLVYARLADMIGDHLTDAEIDELEILSASNEEAKVTHWLNEHIPNLSQGLEEIIEEETARITNSANAMLSGAIPHG